MQLTKTKVAIAMAMLLAFISRASGILENDPNLVLHYDFETQPTNGTVIDTSGYGNNGIQFNTTNYLAYTNGIFGGTAAQFTYVSNITAIQPMSQYVAITNLNSLAVMTNATISVWLQSSPNTNNAVVSILDSGYNNLYVPAASNSWSIGRYGNFDRFLSFWVYPTSGGASNVLKWPTTDITGNFSMTRIHLYTATIDCVSNNATAYFDGAYYTNGPVNVPNLRVYGCSSIKWLCLGANCHNGTPKWGDDAYPNDGFYAGRMDDLRIYNRVLSATEVKALYQAARAVTLSSSGPQQVQLSWRGQANVTYQPESCSDLSSQLWSAVGAPIVSTGGVDTITNAPASNAFFRVRATSP